MLVWAESRGAGSSPCAANGEEALPGLDLDHATDLDVGHRRLALERCGGHRDASGLEAGHRGSGSVDRIDDEDPARLPARVDHAPVL